MHAAIAEKREELARLCVRYGVARLEVFGSAARGADFDPRTSDVDFLVEFDPDNDLPPFERFFGLAGALRAALGRPVDIVEDRAVHNPYLRAAIDRTRELVHASRPAAQSFKSSQMPFTRSRKPVDSGLVSSLPASANSSSNPRWRGVRLTGVSTAAST